MNKLIVHLVGPRGYVGWDYVTHYSPFFLLRYAGRYYDFVGRFWGHVVYRERQACVTPNGRTDGHGSYVRMVNGQTICDFCKRPVS